MNVKTQTNTQTNSQTHKHTNKNKHEAIRVIEIEKWISEHSEVTHWVAIDDMDLSKLDNFVLTARPYNEGIKQSGIKHKIVNFLI